MLLSVLSLPCFYTCSFAGSDSKKCVSNCVCVCLYVPVCENTRKLLTAFFYQVDKFF